MKFNEKIAVWENTKEDLSYLIDTSGDDGFKSAFKALDNHFNTYNSETLNNVFSLWEMNKGISKTMQEYGEAISEMAQDLQAGAQAETVRYKNSIIKFALVLLVSGIILGVLLIYFIVRSVTRPLNSTVTMLKDIAEGEGDLTVRLETHCRDEIGELAAWFNTFLDNLRSMIKDIAGNANTLSDSSHALSSISGKMTQGFTQVSETSGKVSHAAREMNSSMNSVTADMEQTSSNVNTVVTAADEITSSINEIAKYTDKARTITNQAVDEAQSASENINMLGSSMQNIESMSSMISGISEQTNLLELNATIEAARAGEAGKGFAVVANEIKDLARQTTEATQTIKDNIDGIQNVTNTTVRKIEQISRVIHDIDEIVSLIDSTVDEQSSSTKEIAGNITEASKRIQ